MVPPLSGDVESSGARGINAATLDAAPMKTRGRLRFWVMASFLGLGAALACALLAALALSIGTGASHISARGLSVLSGATVAKGVVLIMVYMVFLAMFLIPFAMVIVPLCYWAARQLADGLLGRLLFALLVMLTGTFGPVLVERGLIWLQAWRGLSSGVRELQLAEYFVAFGLVAAPVAAFVLWPVLRKLDASQRGT